MKRKAYILGIDPGLANFGWALVDFSNQGEKLVECGVIRTEKSDEKRNVLASDDNFRRTRDVAKPLLTLFKKYDFAAICAESMSFPRSSSAAAKMAMTWGAIAMLAVEYNLPVSQASPQEIKKTLCGRKDASKEEIEEAVKKRYPTMEGLLDEQKLANSYREHAYDAGAAIITALETSEVIRAFRSLVA
jgi:crossover junction endodeoxyribonuclease RuvC